MRPEHMTIILSLMPSTSGSSDETNITPMPLLLSLFIRLYISTLAATSIPRVGSSKIITLASRMSHLPTTIFCWLPPERFFTSLFIDGVFIFSSFTARLAISRSRFALSTPTGFESVSRFAIAIFSLTSSSTKRPSFFLSSGAQTIPALTASRGLLSFTLLS